MKNKSDKGDQEAQKGKNIAITSYILIVGTLIAWSINSDKHNPFASFHIRQAIGIDLIFLVLGILISGFDSWMVTAPFYVFVMVLWGYGLSGAVQGKRFLIPFFGTYFQKWFKIMVR